MKILYISDTHTLERGIFKSWLPPADTIVHSGDFMNSGYIKRDIIAFLDWFSSLTQYKNKIFIAGNHDKYVQMFPEEFADILKLYPEVTYLENSEVIIDGIKFWGSPWTPYFHNWAFNAMIKIEDATTRNPWIKNFWDLIPADVDVLITHGPPYGILDLSEYGGINCGCPELLKVINKYKPKVHVFGHIHEGYGEEKVGETTFINASVVNLRYIISNVPIVHTIEK